MSKHCSGEPTIEEVMFVLYDEKPYLIFEEHFKQKVPGESGPSESAPSEPAPPETQTEPASPNPPAQSTPEPPPEPPSPAQ